MKKLSGLRTGWFVALAAAQVTLSDGMRNPPEGAVALGRAGGTYVQIDDASVARRNPAELARHMEAAVAASATVGYGTKAYEGGAGTSESERPWAVLPSFFAVWPISKSGAAGFSLTSPYGRSTTFPRDGVWKDVSPFFAQLRSLDASPALGMRLTEALLIGGGINCVWSDLDLKQMFPWSVVTGEPRSPAGVTHFSADGVGWGAQAAMTWEPVRGHRLALVYRSPVKIDYDGTVEVSAVPASMGGGTQGSEFSTTIKFPAVAALAYGLELRGGFRVEANVEWVEHSVFEELPLRVNERFMLVPSTTYPANWKDTWTFGLGLDWGFRPDWTLRGGYIYLPTPIPDDTFMPTIAEEDQSVVSFGLGYRRGAHRFDAAVAVGLLPDRDVRGNRISSAFDGRYSFESHLMAFAYGYRF